MSMPLQKSAIHGDILAQGAAHRAKTSIARGYRLVSPRVWKGPERESTGNGSTDAARRFAIPFLAHGFAYQRADAGGVLPASHGDQIDQPPEFRIHHGNTDDAGMLDG